MDKLAIHAMPDPDHSAPVALEDVLRRAEPKLKRLLGAYKIPVADAEDLIQESCCHLIYQLNKVRDPECWLLGTLKRHCLMYWRRHRRCLYQAVDAAILEWLERPGASPQERRDLLADLHNLIAKLPPRCRSVLRLRFQLGYEPTEVAEKLGYQVSSIGKVTTRCLAALSRELLAAGFSGRSAHLEVLPPGRPEDPRPTARR